MNATGPIGKQHGRPEHVPNLQCKAGYPALHFTPPPSPGIQAILSPISLSLKLYSENYDFRILVLEL